MGAAEANQARISLDLKNADATEIVTALARAADKQPVFHPGIGCRLTLRVKELEWRAALQSVLRACGLGAEEEGSVLRVAPLEQMARERAERAARAGGPSAPESRIATLRLTHARAAELAPILEKMITPGRVSYDARTNTLLFTY